MKKVIDPKHFMAVCKALVESGAKSAIKIVDEKTSVKATWRNKPSGKNHREEIVLTFGNPDYEVAQFIKKCKKAGEPLPVKKIQFRAYPIPRKPKKG